MVGAETFANGDIGERWAVYICVHALIIDKISEGVRSARVKLWEGANVMT